MSEKTESIDFTVKLTAEYWDKKPRYSIVVNDQVVVPESEFSQARGSEIEHAFSVDLPEGEADHVIKVNFLNKEPTDTKKDQYEDPNNFKIVDDMLLIIRGIEIDGISLPVGQDYEFDSESVGYYVTDEPVTYKGVENTTKIPGCTNMGWNGSYCYDFKTPVYLWLLDQIS